MIQNIFQKDVVIFFLDDNYVEEDNLCAFCYGGYFYEGSLSDLNEKIANVKNNLKLEEWMPIKWNFSEDLKNFYKKYWNVDNFDQKWKTLILRSKEIRKELIQQVGSIKILFSAFSTNKGQKVEREWMVENLFQRIGLNMNPNSLNIIMCDFEHEKSETKKVLEEEYFDAYYIAEDYYSGPLKNKGAFPSLSYSSTYFNPFLQISDIIVGCMANLVKNWLKNQNIDDFVKEIFCILKNNFVKQQSTGEIFRYGIISQPENFKNFLHSKGLI